MNSFSTWIAKGLAGVSITLHLITGAHPNSNNFDLKSYLFHHVLDDYKWHIASIGNLHLTIYLPVIVYHSKQGLLVFSSKKLYESPDHTYMGIKLAHYESTGKPYLTPVDKESKLYDFSITKVVFQAFIAGLLLILMLIATARAYARDPYSPPRTWLQRLLEPVIVFVLNEIIKPAMPDKRSVDRFAPYLLTVFFFIFLANLIGLSPFGFNITGNIAVTATLAAFTLIIGHANATKSYWKHVFNTPGVPWWLKLPLPIMPLVELIGIFARHLALAIRLFANIMGGHMNMLTVVGIIFLFAGFGAYAAFGISPVSLLLLIFLLALEMLIALIQAYIFTILSAFFIGMAVTHEEH